MAEYKNQQNAENGWNQCAVVKTSTQTLSFYPLPELPPEDRAFEFVEGKVRVQIHDFSGGKGEAAKDAYFNLDLKDIKFLYKQAEFSSLRVPFYRSKIHSFARDNNGSCKAFHLSITRTPTASDGTLMNNPWCIKIDNGTATAKPGRQKGSYYEAGGSFRATCSLQIRLSDVDFLDIMDKCMFVFDAYRKIQAETSLLARLQKTKEYSKRYSDTTAQEQESAASGYEQPKVNEVNLFVNSEPEVRQEGWAVCICSNGYAESEVWFPAARMEELKNCFQSAIPITAQCYSANGYICSR